MSTHERFKIALFCALVAVGLSVGYRTLAERAYKSEYVRLAVPAIAQAGAGVWKDPWANACEEASIAMVEAYYRGVPLTQKEADSRMQELFTWEDEILGYNEDTGSFDTVHMIASTSVFSATAMFNPSVDDILGELRENRPVIALVNQPDFYNRSPSKRAFASFHVVVISGFDAAKQAFIITDPADGSVRRYGYQRVMRSLRDLGEDGEATGVPVVLFTGPFPAW